MVTSHSSAQRVVVAMSGGVDSSVAAALLLEQGYEVIGITMRLWTEPRPAGFSGRSQCCGVEDVDDARRVAQQLGIPHYTMNLERPFRKFVVDRFLDEYAQGRTPNPCLNCNTFIKFDLFLERALALKADYMATGHYARRCLTPGGVELHRSRDHHKDQSYVLYTMGRRALHQVLFPLGDLYKADVRAIAARFQLSVADKKDSVDICFVPTGDYRQFLQRELPLRPGLLLDESGTVLGQHQGVQHFTIGQRRGLGLPDGTKRYVIALNARHNTVTVGTAPELFVESLEAHDVHWLTDDPPYVPLRVKAKVRYRSPLLPSTVQAQSGARAELHFDAPAKAVAPGQSVVFYLGDRVLGGGTIASTRRPKLSDSEHSRERDSALLQSH